MDDDEYDCPLSLSRSEGPTAPFCEKARTAQQALFKTAKPSAVGSRRLCLRPHTCRFRHSMGVEPGSEVVENFTCFLPSVSTRVAALVLRLVIEDKIIDPPRWMRRIADPQRDAA